MSAPSHPVELQPFTVNPSPVRGICGDLSRVADGVRVTFRLDADLDRLRIPAPRPARCTDELWRHTCFELFVARASQERYWEFNFAPSGEWALYAFARYRERLPLAAPTPPQLIVRRGEDWLELEATVALAPLDPALAAAPLRIGLSAVVEARDNSLAYWALHHPGARPDFHHRDAFVLELDEIRH